MDLRGRGMNTCVALCAVAWTFLPRIAAADTLLPVTIAGYTYQLPFTAQLLETASDNPSFRVIVSLEPILNDRMAILRTKLASRGKCGTVADVADVILSPAPPGAHVRVEADFILCYHGAKVGSQHRGHVDATLLPVVVDRHSISFRARDGAVSGSLGSLFKGKIRDQIEQAVRKGAPTFDAERVGPVIPFVPNVEVQDVRLSGSGNAWNIDATLRLSRHP
jgi:hypothetical protein